MLNDSQLGIRTAGQVLRAPTTSAISGKALVAGDVTISFPDSAYTIGVRGHEWRRMSAAEKAAVKAELRKQFPAEPTGAQPDASPLDAMSGKELDALADSEGIDLAGRRTLADKISAITAARALKRFGGSLDSSAESSAESEAS